MSEENLINEANVTFCPYVDGQECMKERCGQWVLTGAEGQGVGQCAVNNIAHTLLWLTMMLEKKLGGK